MHTMHPFHPDDFPVDKHREFYPTKAFFLRGAIHFKQTAQIVDVTDHLDQDPDPGLGTEFLAEAAEVANDLLEQGRPTFEISSCGNMMRTIKTMTDGETGDKLCDLNMTFVSFGTSSIRFAKESPHCRHAIELCPVGDIMDGAGAGRNEKKKHEAFVRHSIAYFWDMTQGPVGKLYKSLNQKRVEIARIGAYGFDRDAVLVLEGDELDDVVAVATCVILLNGRTAMDS